MTDTTERAELDTLLSLFELDADGDSLYRRAADLLRTQAERIASLEAEHDKLRAEVERLRAGLLETARMVEDLKRPVSMDNPESPQAARNSLYMSISYFARAIESAKEQQ